MAVEATITLAITNVVVVSLEGLAKSTLNIFFISLVSCGISFAGGLLKEIIDALIGSGFDWVDLMADLGGCAIAAAVILVGIGLRTLLRHDSKMKEKRIHTTNDEETVPADPDAQLNA
ncbi:MAG: hypothetical protein EZS28_020530 [Streblomastix strix]|uniref:Uncharacterized protein n=1 Tax=Streblomastix strix TaxID=222440 RepID=A0A5J4VMT9_9EUKA|nr:MAG: hypothetical protein EZS28_020530 [Streblomastix strix]